MTRILRFAFQQFGHAEDAGQRGTHIVGHVGEEGALGAVGGFGKLLLAVDLERGVRRFRAAPPIPTMPMIPMIPNASPVVRLRSVAAAKRGSAEMDTLMPPSTSPTFLS